MDAELKSSGYPKVSDDLKLGKMGKPPGTFLRGSRRSGRDEAGCTGPCFCPRHGHGGQGRLSPPCRWAVRQRWSSSNTVSWPTSSGCWWRGSTCTPCSPSPSSPSGSTSGGVPSTFTTVWAIVRIHFEDYGCWDIIDSSLWWIIKGPILTSILVNFILFICIIRILLQKLRPPDIRKSGSSPYSRLARSTLLLIPLFGVHYIMFAFFPDNFKAEVKMVFELIVGSFQGFVVAILYCFLNGEVQAELRRKWRRWHLQGVLGWNPKYRPPSGGSNSGTCSTQVSMLTRVSPGARRSSSFQAEVSLV
ncbi:vasoactive intestinal polypeptide receptor 1 isoform X3 [Cebus imitator]|uniref:vasoactive intestinal polypeptide receptor 1 isoform X3 n=1 Tax=Cebus imitator TaxID=2715852 RepID=UPI00189AA4FD|nr:vasoactive intestinal polypeptide receptor 1 isoform X3 [Cebus imitator]